MEIEIRTPQTIEEWQAYYDLRYEVLRKPWNQPKGSERDDKEHLGIHYALFKKGAIIGVLRADINNEENYAQLRFMAIHPNFQGLKLGEKLIACAENDLIQQGIHEIFLHAREKAVNFYTRLGYLIIEKSHLLYNDIQHFKIKKTIG